MWYSYIHSNIHPFCDQFYKEMLIFYVVIEIEIAINPHIKTSIIPTFYSKNSSNY